MITTLWPPAWMGIFPLCSKLTVKLEQLESTVTCFVSNIMLSAADISTEQ